MNLMLKCVYFSRLNVEIQCLDLERKTSRYPQPGWLCLPCQRAWIHEVLTPTTPTHPPPQEVFPACSVTQSCLTLCNAMHCSPPGSYVHGILHARILQWAAMLSSRGSFQPRDQTQVSCLLHWQAGSLPLGPSGKPLPTKRLILSKSFLPCWKRDVEQWGVQNLPQMPTGLPGKVKAIYCVHPSIINIQGPSQRRTGLACVAESTPYTYF